jgi:hypothetical protein
MVRLPGRYELSLPDVPAGAQQYQVAGSGVTTAAQLTVTVSPKDVVTGIRPGKFFRIVKINTLVVPLNSPVSGNPMVSIYRNAINSDLVVHGATDARAHASDLLDVVINTQDKIIFRFVNIDTSGPTYTLTGSLLFYVAP